MTTSAVEDYKTIVNAVDSEPTFQGSLGNSCVDLMIIRFNNPRIRNWRVRNTPFLSDYLEIEYEYKEENQMSHQTIQTSKRYLWKSMNWLRLREYLVEELEIIYLDWVYKISSEKVVATLTRKIQVCCERAANKRIKCKWSNFMV